MSATLVTQADLEARNPPRVIRELWCDDGSGTPDATRLAASIAVGSREAEGILLKAWSEDEIGDMVSGDEAVKQLVCELVVCHGIAGRPHLAESAVSRRKAARQVLEDLAAARKRSVAENGGHPVLQTRINRPETPQFMFTPSTNTDHSKLGGF